jgi:hypothetical protein
MSWKHLRLLQVKKVDANSNFTTVLVDVCYVCRHTLEELYIVDVTFNAENNLMDKFIARCKALSIEESKYALKKLCLRSFRFVDESWMQMLFQFFIALSRMSLKSLKLFDLKRTCFLYIILQKKVLPQLTFLRDKLFYYMSTRNFRLFLGVFLILFLYM